MQYSWSVIHGLSVNKEVRREHVVALQGAKSLLDGNCLLSQHLVA